MTKLKGQCRCRAVTYAVDDAFAHALNFHCSNCRRTTGAGCNPFGGIALDRFHDVAGAQDLRRFGDGGDHDLHCAICGSVLYSAVRSSTYADVALGTQVDAPAIRPTAHIFLGSKAPWHEITDDLPHYAEFG